MEKEIRIVDSGADRYSLEPKELCLGRMYDNKSETISIIRPVAERDSICTMIITDINGKVIDHITMDSDAYIITSAISPYNLVKIGFSFSRADGYIKGSEIILGKFLQAPKPDGFIPVEPEQKKNIDYLTSYGFTNSRLNGNSLEFFNMNGDKVVSFDLSPFTQEQSDWAETDSSKETFIKNKPTIPTKTSELENDSGFVTKAVKDLQNYYDIDKVDELIASVSDKGSVIWREW